MNNSWLNSWLSKLLSPKKLTVARNEVHDSFWTPVDTTTSTYKGNYVAVIIEGDSEDKDPIKIERMALSATNGAIIKTLHTFQFYCMGNKWEFNKEQVTRISTGEDESKIIWVHKGPQ